jgi:DNA helicase-2/ATP-dependent DNA helicase PcrA
LPELLAEILGCGEGSQTVVRAYAAVLARLGSELSILRELPTAALAAAGPPLLAEAIRRVRAGQVTRTPGYDGTYGTIRVFEPGEIGAPRRQSSRRSAATTADTPPPAGAWPQGCSKIAVPATGERVRT